MGLIQIEGMEFYSFHGHYKEERIVGNKFLVDLTIETDMQKASESDNLKDAVNSSTLTRLSNRRWKRNHTFSNI
jgi:7,8-dihydroneopterin aldolase/epimerase/oxygenase